MDCPTEQTLIQNKLGKLEGVQQLEFNLINRVLGVTHDLPNDSPIIDAIQSIRHGDVHIVIQDGNVIQINKTEKVRLK